MSSSSDIPDDYSSCMNNNGDIMVTSKTTLNSIKSVQENPFFKHFGIKHNIPPVSRRNRRPDAHAQSNRHSLNGPSLFGNDDIGEYRPMSGFVHKLLDKFSLLSATRDDSTTSQLFYKRSSSLDEVKNEVTGKQDMALGTSLIPTFDKSSNLLSTTLSSKFRSTENLTHTYEKPPSSQSNAVLVQRTEHGTYRNKQSTASNCTKNSDLSGNSIVIIEKTTEPSKGFTNDDTNKYDGQSDLFVNHEIVSKDELPKPNTVLTVRNIFETAFQTGSLIRRYKSDQSLTSSINTDSVPYQTEVTVSSQEAFSKQSIQGTLLKNLGENNTKQILQSSSVPTSQSFNHSKHQSDSHSHIRADVRSLSGNISINPERNDLKSVTSSQENSGLISNSEPVFDNKPPGSKVNIPSGAKSSNLQNPVPSPHSSASVSPTKINNQSSQVRPESLSPSASTTTTYHKSRPVVSVAPYKDKPDDKNDDQVAIISTVSKLRHEKSQQGDYYTQLNDVTKLIKDNNQQSNVLLKEAKKIFENNSQLEHRPNNRIENNSQLEHRPNNRIENNSQLEHRPNNRMLSHGKNHDKSTENNLTNKTVTAKNHLSVVEVRNDPVITLDKEHMLIDTRSGSPERESELKPISLIASSRSKLTNPKRVAPQPPAQLQSNKNSVTPIITLRSQDPNNDLVTHTVASRDVYPTTKNQHPKEDLSKNSLYNKISDGDVQLETERDIAGPHKRSHAKDPATMNEQPLKKVIKEISESLEQPVKGIPSIISQRLKNQNSNPSHVAYDVVKSSENIVSINTDLYPRTLLNPVGTNNRTLLNPVGTNNNRSCSDHSQKDTISSEIENEIFAIRTKMEANRSKVGGPAQIFDSSQLKRKNKDKLKQQSTQEEGLVPLLDLSAITGDGMEYRPQMASVKPCNIVFVGENAKTSRSLLDKKRKIKINVQFNDLKTETFEYLREEIALEDYLADHPHEREELLVLEDLSGMNGESSDDVDVDMDEMITGNVINGSVPASNTSLGHSGSLQSYRGRYQEEYQFGDILTEQIETAPDTEPIMNPEKLMLRPAEEDNNNTWSTSDSSDLLF